MSADSFEFSSSASRVATSPIRELFGLLDCPDIVSLASGLPSKEALDIDGLSKATSMAVKQSAAVAFRYGATAGYDPLRELLVQRERDKGIPAERGRLLVTSGSQQAIDLVCRILVNPGENVVVEAPTRLGALLTLRFQGAKLRAVVTDEEGIDVDELRRTAELHRPKLLYLIPSFSNPTGRITSLKRRKEILWLAKEFRFYVVEDDPHSELYFNEPPPPSLYALADDEERDWVIHISSLSKILAPGLRVAWLAAPQRLMGHLTTAKQLCDTHTSMLSQLVVFHYLNGGSLEPALSRARRFYVAQSAVMSKAIRTELKGSAFKFARPEGGLFFWGRLEGLDTTKVLEDAIRSGVAFMPGAAFYTTDSVNDCLRLSFASATAEQIVTGVKHLAKVIDRWS
ncbi:PLP-dependent aminotransferase family protein [Paraburkholderia sp. IMGN_8]|uniref:aminotransferase-like domain-containing protein n=1 Tax=Paraburkholderia sp. IMGN_8 TaxID=3136564 RepID=UPI0031011AC3